MRKDQRSRDATARSGRVVVSSELDRFFGESNPMRATLILAGIGWVVILLVAILLSPLRPRFLSCVKRAWVEFRDLTFGRDDEGDVPEDTTIR